VYGLFSILFFIFGCFAVIIGGPPLIAGYEWGHPSIVSGVRIFRIVVIVFFGAGIVITSLLFVAVRRRGFVAYKRIIDRLSSERSMNFNLNITFPETDEFGNLGKVLNKFIEQMRQFDKIKVERLRTSQQKVAALSEAIDKGVMVISSENRISFANSHVIKLLNIGDKTVIGLPINKVIENETLQNSLEELRNKPKNQVLEDLRIKYDEIVYKTKVTVIPIISSEVSLMETIIIFDYITKKVLNI
jgi:transcriptional regulator with PAS, ATPase and Fis domain